MASGESAVLGQALGERTTAHTGPSNSSAAVQLANCLADSMLCFFIGCCVMLSARKPSNHGDSARCSAHTAMQQLGMFAGALLAGGAAGNALATRMKITDLPQMVAAFHSLVGLAAVTTSVANYMGHDPAVAMDSVHLVATYLGTWIGAVTLTGISGSPLATETQQPVERATFSSIKVTGCLCQGQHCARQYLWKPCRSSFADEADCAQGQRSPSESCTGCSHRSPSACPAKTRSTLVRL